VAKYVVELDLHAAHEMFGIDYVVFRPHNVYGEYQNIGDRYRNVVGIFMNRLLQGQPMPVFGDGTQQRAFSYVGDVAPIIARSPLVPAARNQVFNLGADRPYRILDLASAVATALGVPSRIEHLPPRQEVHVAYASHERCREVFSSVPETPLEEGLARMAAWVRQAGARTTSEFAQIEIRDRLPAAWSDWRGP
jgi:UDP-glucose 4-epimerase